MAEKMVPSIITHKNMQPLLDEICGLPAYQPGSREDPPDWVHQEVVLEFPLGEICEDGLKTLAICGTRKPETMDLIGVEKFNAQGLEGKCQIRKDLFSALMNLRDLIPEHRGRILCPKRKEGEDGESNQDNNR